MNRSALRQMSKKKRAKLAELGIHYPTSTLVGGKTSKTFKKATNTDPDAATVAVVMERDRGRCVGCGELVYGPRGVGYSIHHRKRRSQGLDNSPANLILLCGHGTSQCHGLAHSEVAESRLSGFLLRSTENPEEIAVEHSQHGRVFLLDDGSVRAVMS